MPTINICNNPFLGFTPVSNIFIEHYLAKSNATYVKIYLYTLYSCMHTGNDLSTKKIASLLNILESDVIESLNYWEKQNVISMKYLDDGSLTIQFLNLSVPEQKVTETNNRPKILKLEKRPEYSPEELALYNNVPEIKQMFLVAQQYLAKPLSPTELNILYSFYDWLRLPTDVIELLLEYCISNNHRSMRYIEKVAITWADQGINTVEKAKQQLYVFNKKYRSVMKAFGISRREPAPTEIELMKKWIDEYKLDIEIIIEACNRTIQNTSIPSFPYTDKIITQWYKNKVRTFDDIKAIDNAFAKKKSIQSNIKLNNTKKKINQPTKTKFINFKQRDDWDFDQLEKLERQYLEKELSGGK